MIEVSMVEVLLLAWAGIATAAWLHARDDSRTARRMLMMFIENKDARDQVLKAHDEFVRRQGERI